MEIELSTFTEMQPRAIIYDMEISAIMTCD